MAAAEFRNLLVCTGGQKKRRILSVVGFALPNCLAILAKIVCSSCGSVAKMG